MGKYWVYYSEYGFNFTEDNWNDDEEYVVELPDDLVKKFYTLEKERIEVGNKLLAIAREQGFDENE